MSSTPLRVLLVEDSQTDADLVLRELKRGGLVVESLRVDTAPDYLAAIEDQSWDVILSDFSMPDFNGMAAFALLTEQGLDIPFIFVSGRIGEEMAAEAMRLGAKDYVLKDNLNRLVPAVARELKETEERRKRQAIADALRESDEKLRGNERLLQTVFDTIPHALLVKDRQSRYLMVNSTWCERYGLAAADVVGKTTLEIPGRTDVDRQRAFDEDQAVFGRGESVTFDGVGTIHGGALRHYHTIKSPLRDAAGQITGVVGIVVDLTEQKLAEEALRQSNEELESAIDQLRAAHLSLEAETAERQAAEQRFRQVVELAPHAMVIVNAEGRIELVNAQLLAWFGHERDELIGQPVEILIPERHRAGHPASVDGFFRAPVLRSMGTGPELHGLRKDGAEFPMEIRLSSIETTNGLQVIASIVDMTAIKRAEAEVRASQRLLQTVFDTIPHMLIVKDSESRILMVNKAWSNAYGIAPEAAVNRRTLDLPYIPEAEKRGFLEEDRQVFTGASTYSAGERWFTIKDGRRIPVLSYKTPLYDDTGTVTGLVGLFVDISDRVRAEQDLLANQRLLQTVFNTIPHMLVVRDAQGRHQMVNKAWSDFHGVSQAEALNRTVLDFHQRPEPEIRASFEEDQKILADQGASVMNERVMTGSDGKKHSFLSIRDALRDEKGKPVGSVGILVDLTAEREAQHRADLAHARLVGAIESLPAAFFLYDAEERLVLWNSRVRDLFPSLYANLQPGMRFEDVLRAAADSIEPARGRLDDWLRERLAQFRANSGTYEQLLADGRWVQGLDHRTSDGGTVCLRFDVTETKRQEEILRQSQKLEAIGSLAGGISHDFNNLLTVISSHAGFIVDEAGGLRQILEDAQMIQDAATRAAALTRQLLAFSRKQVLQMQVLDINGIVGNLEKMLQRLIGENIELRSSLAPTIGRIHADPTQIEQIVMNLVVNARDAMPKGGKLLIETANKALDETYVSTHTELTPGDYVMLAVTDTGHGMDQATKTRVFEPFFTTKPLGKGTGMGLATVYGIVKQMNGSVFVYSELGKGTTFKIYFPVSVDGLTPAIASESSGHRTRATETVLLVEDEELVRKSAARILEGEGYAVLQASSAEEAQKIADSHGARIDLLLSDVVMPGISGRELWDRIRQAMPIRVLFMSGYTDDAIVRNGILEGGVPFLNKPFSKHSLINKVREVLRNSIPNGTTIH